MNINSAIRLGQYQRPCIKALTNKDVKLHITLSHKLEDV